MTVNGGGRNWLRCSVNETAVNKIASELEASGRFRDSFRSAGQRKSGNSEGRRRQQQDVGGDETNFSRDASQGDGLVPRNRRTPGGMRKWLGDGHARQRHQSWRVPYGNHVRWKSFRCAGGSPPSLAPAPEEPRRLSFVADPCVVQRSPMLYLSNSEIMCSPA